VYSTVDSASNYNLYAQAAAGRMPSAADRVADFRERPERPGASGSVRQPDRDSGAGRVRRSAGAQATEAGRQPADGVGRPGVGVPRSVAVRAKARLEPAGRS